MGDVLLVAVLALPLVGFWLVLRGQQRRSAQAARLASSLRVGQAVVTTSGLYGTVAALDESVVTLLVAPGVELRFDRRAVGQVLDDEGDTPSPE